MSDLVKAFKFREGNVRDLDAFFNNYLWFAALSSLNDPYEGYARFCSEGVTNELRINFLKKVFSTELSKDVDPELKVREIYLQHREKGESSFGQFVDSKASEILRPLHHGQRDDTFVYSLSLSRDDDSRMPSPLNNMQMWSHYAGGFKGFCMEFDFEKLRQSLREINGDTIATSQITYATDHMLPRVSIKLLMESYLSDDHTASSMEILQAFATKQASWEYENEVRLMAHTSGKMYFNPECIRAIYIANPMPEWTKTFLAAAASSKGRHIKVFDVHLHSEQYCFGIRELSLFEDD